jgi:hypothetical protein
MRRRSSSPCSCAPTRAVLLIAACSSPGTGPGPHYFTRTEEEGVPVSITGGGPRYEGEIFDYVEVCRLEQDESREETLLFQVFGYLMGDDGRIYVSDGGNGRIAVFDGEGRYLSSFGRKGQGPGEFGYPQLLEVRDGEVLTYDMQNRRAGRFRTDGTFGPLVGSSMTSRIHPLPDGDRVLIVPESEMQPGSPVLQRTHCLVVSAEGDTLAQVSTPWTDMGRMITTGNMGFTARRMYSTRSAVDYFPGGEGILAWDNSVPELRWYGLDGILARIHRLDWRPQPVPEEVKAGARRSYEYPLENLEREDMRPMYEARLKHFDIADIYPFWSGVVMDDAGYHWLQRAQDYARWEPDWELVHAFDVLSPQGEHLGRSSFPYYGGTLSRGHLIVSREDPESGETVYVVFRLDPVPEGLVYP